MWCDWRGRADDYIFPRRFFKSLSRPRLYTYRARNIRRPRTRESCSAAVSKGSVSQSLINNKSGEARRRASVYAWDGGCQRGGGKRKKTWKLKGLTPHYNVPSDPPRPFLVLRLRKSSVFDVRIRTQTYTPHRSATRNCHNLLHRVRIVTIRCVLMTSNVYKCLFVVVIINTIILYNNNNNNNSNNNR